MNASDQAMEALERLSAAAMNARNEIHVTGAMTGPTFAALLARFERAFYPTQRLATLSQMDGPVEAQGREAESLIQRPELRVRVHIGVNTLGIEVTADGPELTPPQRVEALRLALRLMEAEARD
jgi:hypothetical protein